MCSVSIVIVSSDGSPPNLLFGVAASGLAREEEDLGPKAVLSAAALGHLILWWGVFSSIPHVYPTRCQEHPSVAATKQAPTGRDKHAGWEALP